MRDLAVEQQLYMEWITTQLPTQRLPNINPSHLPGNPQGPCTTCPYIAFFATVSSPQP